MRGTILSQGSGRRRAAVTLSRAAWLPRGIHSGPLHLSGAGWLVCVLFGLGTVSAHAETGVSDERVTLPDGPGSIGGVGENASVSGNMGAMTYGLPIEVPSSFPGATPSLQLSYSSVSGSGEVGIGWELRVPHIERSSLRGLPIYDGNDRFAADGHEELVRVATDSAGNHTYRARFEGGFVRYIWHADAAGSGGYWEAQYPDGNRGFFGANARGVPVPTARVSHPQGGVFRYLLVEMLDRFDHAVRYDYALHGDYPLLSQVQYLFSHGEPRYRITFQYEDRPDVLSSALSGFDLRLTKRLSGVEMFSRGTRLECETQPECETRLGRYALSYEQVAAGVSRLTSVQRFGLHDEKSPIAFSFAYSSALDFSCRDCQRPYVFDMGTLEAGGTSGVDLQNGRSTLIDINGDSLPDVLDTGENGNHRFFLNTMQEDGSQVFAPPFNSELTRGSSEFKLKTPGVQVVDINGDGFTDIIDAGGNKVLCNLGQGDWVRDGTCASHVAIKDLTPDQTGGPDPLHIRFMDYDGDKRIDLLHTVANDTAFVLHNLPSGFVQKSIEAIGAMFDDSPLQLADINGDGLLDPVTVAASGSTGVVRYRLNLGYGRWTPFVERIVVGATGSELSTAELQDLNGDGLDDVVIVGGDNVKVAVNQAGSFLPFLTLHSADVTGGELPIFDNSTTVLFADVNGSGSTDVVWIEADGRVRVLELFPVRPNLLTRIENGIGGVQVVEYGTSARELARDQAAGQPWRHKLPYPMNIVTATDRFTTLTPTVKQRVRYLYRHGFYDGREKRYRGFEVVEQLEAGDETQQSGRAVSEYDVGATDPYYNGRLMREQVFGGDDTERHRIQRVLHQHEDCKLADIPTQGLRLAVRYVCQTGTETLLQEGRPEAEWVTLKTTAAYDGYGNVTASSSLGVVGMGPHGTDACPPCTAPEGTVSGACGADCVGDERFEETSYIDPGLTTGGAWVLGRAARQVAYGAIPGPFTEQLTYYDGQPFVGLPAGSERAGLVRRVCARQTEQAQSDCHGTGWVMQQRNDHDQHGNITDTVDPLGDPDVFTGHRRQAAYDAHGLRPTTVRIFLANQEGPYELRRYVQYDPIFYAPSSISRWQLASVESDRRKLASEAPSTHIAYDNFGRRRALTQPDDPREAPSTEFEYELADPVSRIVIRNRSQSGAPADLEQVRCVDGFGRTAQTRTRLSSSLYQVTGFHEVNPQGSTVRLYEPYQGPAACDAKPPREVAHSEIYYDALGRPLRTTQPDASLYGAASVISFRYGPLTTQSFDAEDNDPRSSAFDTPHMERTDGLGRVVELQRSLTTDGQGSKVRMLFDPLGHSAGFLDPAGTRKVERFDLLGRIVHLEDPNSGTVDFEYDAASNLTKRRDARGETMSMRYDGANRSIARFDASDEASTLVSTRYDFTNDCEECSHGEGRAVATSYPLPGQSTEGRDESGFDLRGRRTFEARTLSGHRFITRHAFDHADREISTTYPDSTVVARRFDSAARVVAIDGVIEGVEYDPRALMHRVRYANGVRWERTFDALQRVAQARTIDADGLVLQGFEYERDRVGNLLAVRDVSDPRSGQLDWGVRFEHDTWYRTTSATFSTGERIDVSFDVLDNITRKVSSWAERGAAHVGRYRYAKDRPNAVIQAGPRDYEYDGAGHTVARGTTAMHWDFAGRLESAVTDQGEVQYVYGPGQERVMELGKGSVAYYVGPDFEVRDGISRTYARLDQLRVGRSSRSELAATLLSDLAPVGGDGRIDVSDAWLWARQGNPPLAHLRSSARRLLFEADSQPVFLHGDHLTSLTLSTSVDGKVRGERAYDATGVVRAMAGYVDEHGFTGQRMDELTGLNHFGFRELDPQVARWASPDPLFQVTTPALMARWGEATTAYAYVGNQHATSFDPTGLAAEHAGGGLTGSAAPAAGARGFPQSVGRFAAGFATGAVAGVTLLAVGGSTAVRAAARATHQHYGGGARGVAAGAGAGLAVAVIAVSALPFAVTLGAAYGAFVGPTQVRATFAVPDQARQVYESAQRGLASLSRDTHVVHDAVDQIGEAQGLAASLDQIGKVVDHTKSMVESAESLVKRGQALLNASTSPDAFNHAAAAFVGSEPQQTPP